MVTKTGVFETPNEPPPVGSKQFFCEEWSIRRDLAVSPSDVSALADDRAGREEFLEGAGLLRIHGPRAKRGMELVPQQLLVADVLNAGEKFNSILMPRRSSKTTSLFALALGRLHGREDYNVAYSMATTATKARQRFLFDLVPPLEQLFPDPKTSPFKINKAAGMEYILDRETGSRFSILPPKGESFRSDAWDLIIVDEGGEADPDSSEDIVTGALATMDTRPGAQFVVAGTAAKFRKGNLLWDELERGRLGEGGTLSYHSDQNLTPEDIESWEDALAELLLVHPGIGTLTTTEDVRGNFVRWPRARFLAEYLGVFGQVGATSFIPQTAWARGLDVGRMPQPPAMFTMAFQVHPDSTVASVVAAWRVDGRAQLLVLFHGPVRQLGAEVARLAVKYRMAVAYDSGNAATDSEAQRLGRLRPRPRLMPQNWANVSTAASLLVKDISAENVTHWGQDELTTAVGIATKRGTRESKRWSFGRRQDEDDITALEAAAIALRAYDENPPRQALRPVVSA